VPAKSFIGNRCVKVIGKDGISFRMKQASSSTYTSLIYFHPIEPPYVNRRMVMQNRRWPTEAHSSLTEIAIIVFVMSLSFTLGLDNEIVE
jgi:hypothetical protein